MNYFATNVRYLRKINKLTQEEMGKKLGKSLSTISAWEVGTRQPIVKDTIEICKAFRVDLDDLLYADLSENPSLVDSNLNKIIELYKQLTTVQQEAIISTMEAMVR